MLDILKRAGAYKRVLNTDSKDVQIIVRDLVRFCHLTQPIHMQSHADMAQLEGRRQVLLRIFAFIEKDHQKRIELLRKQIEEEDDDV